MNTTISLSLSQLAECRDDDYMINQRTAFASDLGWPPGKIPARIKVQERWGNGQDFVLAKWDEGSFTYIQANGLLRIKVFND